MTTLIKIISALFGYDYELVQRQPTVSKQKIVTMGTLLIIPVFLWVFSGFYLSHEVMGKSLSVSIFVGLILGLIILIVDRSFVATPKTTRSLPLLVIRFSFALISTILGSLALDMVVFSGDLEEYRLKSSTAQKQEFIKEYKIEHSGELDRVLKEIGHAQQRHQSLVKAHLSELDGSGGTGKYGVGKVAAVKGKEKDRAKLDLDRLQELYKVEEQKLELAAQEYALGKSEKKSDAIMSKLKDLHEFVFADHLTIVIYSVFFLFMFLLESFFILYKSFVSDTLYDDMLKAEEEYGREKLFRHRESKARLAQEKEILGVDHDKVKRVLVPSRIF